MNGEQERTLNLSAFKTGRLIADRQLPGDAIESVIEAALAMPNYRPHQPWKSHEIETKVRRAVDQGKRVRYCQSSCIETLAEGPPFPNRSFDLG